MTARPLRSRAHAQTARRSGYGRRRRKRSKLLVVGNATACMTRSDDGWFAAEVRGAKAGTRYRFRIDDELDVPDPASAFQPDDVAGPSEVVDHAAYRWRASDWRGRPWHETVLLECHVGTFTPEGTYRGMIDKLDHIVDTGITAIELMPLADFPGRGTGATTACCGMRPITATARRTISRH